MFKGVRRKQGQFHSYLWWLVRKVLVHLPLPWCKIKRENCIVKRALTLCFFFSTNWSDTMQNLWWQVLWNTLWSHHMWRLQGMRFVCIALVFCDSFQHFCACGFLSFQTEERVEQILVDRFSISWMVLFSRLSKLYKLYSWLHNQIILKMVLCLNFGIIDGSFRVHSYRDQYQSFPYKLSLQLLSFLLSSG